MNNDFVIHSIKFIGLILVQVAVCNNINFLGYINPNIYIIFILLYPINSNRLLFIFLSFLLGVGVDVFLDSGGVHAAASVFLAFVRPVILRASFKTLYDHQSLKIGNSDLKSLFVYITLSTLLHHLILFSLEIFNISNVLIVLRKTLFSSIFTVVLSVLLIKIFSRNKK